MQRQLNCRESPDKHLKIKQPLYLKVIYKDELKVYPPTSKKDYNKRC